MKAIILNKKGEIIYTGSMSGAKKAIRKTKGLFSEAHSVTPVVSGLHKPSMRVRTGMASSKKSSRAWVKFYQDTDMVYDRGKGGLVKRIDCDASLLSKRIVRNSR